MQILFNKQAKTLFELPKNTPDATLSKILGNWKFKTLIYTSYARAANIWLK